MSIFKKVLAKGLYYKFSEDWFPLLSICQATMKSAEPTSSYNSQCFYKNRNVEIAKFKSNQMVSDNRELKPTNLYVTTILSLDSENFESKQEFDSRKSSELAVEENEINLQNRMSTFKNTYGTVATIGLFASVGSVILGFYMIIFICSFIIGMAVATSLLVIAKKHANNQIKELNKELSQKAISSGKKPFRQDTPTYDEYELRND